MAVARPAVSLVIISMNEALNIERCIRSVPWVEDIVVLDSGSQDATVPLAQQCGARVFVEKWRGYRDQKNRALDLAQHDWIISLDADEALSPEASEELQQALERPDLRDTDGFEFPRLSHYMGRWIRHGGWYPDRQLRVFNRQKSRWQAGHLHERATAQNAVCLKFPLYHWPFPNLAEQVSTNNNYSTLGARDLFDRGQRFSYTKLLLKPLSKFFETYCFKLGFLDGFPGLVISIGAAYSVFLKFAKLREMEMRNLKM